MGFCFSCCKSKTSECENLVPDAETKRRQQAEAAERRIKEQESRGLKDPEGVKRKMQKKKEMEKKEELAGNKSRDNALTWTVG